MFQIITKSLKKNKWYILLDAILLLMSVYILALPPKIIGDIIDLILKGDFKNQEVLSLVLLLIFACIILIVLRIGWKYVGTCTQRALERDIKNALFKHLTKLKLSEMQKRKNGEFMTYFVKDTVDIRAFVWRGLAFLPRIIYTFILVTALMIINVDLKLTLVAMIPVFIAPFLIVKIRKYIDLNFRRAQKQFTNLSEYVQESTDSIRTTKAYSQETSQIRTFMGKNKRLKSSNISVDVHSNLLDVCLKTCFGISYGIGILYGSNLVLNGTISMGSFVAFNSYIALFISPITWIPGLISKWKSAQIAYHRIDHVLELEREKGGIVTKADIEEKMDGNIRIADLSYHYPEYMDSVLKHININIQKGQTLGIIGTIGSGKTTLMNLLLKLYQVPRGKLWIDGRDINDIPVRVLRDNICYITQDNFLFSDTIKENIKLFKEDYNDEEIIDSTKKAMIYDEIMAMPEKINTVLAERGSDLSGGQKQRVVISRAFLNNSNIVIFDDTFSALDNKTEQLVMKNVKELTKDKTCIIISNRISDLKDSDHIIVLDNREIIEEGIHEELLNHKQKYYEFYLEQMVKKEDSILN